MNRKTIPPYRALDSYLLKGLPALTFWTLLILCSDGALAQAASVTLDTSSSVHATHLLGFQGAKNNAKGTLSIQDNALQFQDGGKPAVQVRVKIASVQDVFLGEQSKQVGGLPMTLGKTAAPYGGGRVVSIFAHKNYDTLTLEYVDADGGFHGAIFQLDKGQAEVFRNELVTSGAHVTASENKPAKRTTTEVVSGSN
jgi:hypothetical protein